MLVQYGALRYRLSQSRGRSNVPFGTALWGLASYTGQTAGIDPRRTFKIGPMNGR